MSDKPTDQTDFKDTTVIKVVRFEQYPLEEPTSFAVGFTVTLVSNNKSIYRDTAVPFTATANKTDSEIVALAWEEVKAGVMGWYDATKTASAMVGSVFVP